MWQLSHVSQYISLFNINFFANHTNLIAYILLPFYKIAPHPFTLVAFKVVSIVGAGYVLYLLTKEKLGPFIAIFFMVLYFLYPPNIFGILYEFDFESVAPFLLILMYYFYSKDRWKMFMLLAVIVILVKENMPLVVMAFGIHGLFTKADKLRWGFTPICLGCGAFYFLMKVFLPWAQSVAPGQSYGYINWNYAHLGGSIGGMIKTAFVNPRVFVTIIFDPENINWFHKIFGQFLYLPFFSLSTLFLISPVIAQHLLSAGAQEQSIYFQYVTPIAPFVFLAAVRSFGLVIKLWPQLKYPLLLSIFLLSCLNLCMNVEVMKLKYSPKPESSRSHFIDQRWNMLHMIPPEVPVVATFGFLAELSNRAELYSLHKVYAPEYQPYYVPNHVRYALLDFDDPWLVEAFEMDPNLTFRQMYNFFDLYKWSVKSAAENIVLLEKNKENPVKLLEHSKQSRPFMPSFEKVNIGDQIHLLSLNKGTRLSDDPRIIPLTFYWRADQDIKSDLAIAVGVRDNEGIVVKRIRRLGRPVYPVWQWPAGEYIMENYWLVLPRELKDNPILEMEFYKVNKELRAFEKMKISSDSVGIINEDRLKLNLSELK